MVNGAPIIGYSSGQIEQEQSESVFLRVSVPNAAFSKSKDICQLDRQPSVVSEAPDPAYGGRFGSVFGPATPAVDSSASAESDGRGPERVRKNRVSRTAQKRVKALDRQQTE